MVGGVWYFVCLGVFDKASPVLSSAAHFAVGGVFGSLVVCLSEYSNTLSVLSLAADQAVEGMVGGLFV